MRTQNAGIRKVGVTNNGETHGSREKGWLELKKANDNQQRMQRSTKLQQF